MPVQLSGGGNYTPAKRIATPPAPITGSVQNMSTGRVTTPAEPLNNPAYTPPANYGYDLPANTPVPSTANYGAPDNWGASGPAPAPAAPEPPSAPVGGRQWYSALSEGDRAAQDQQWLGGDSDYTSQIAEYDRALQSFIDRIAGQKKLFNQDADDALASTGRNQTMSLNSLGEDFGARGLSYSGLFDQSKNQTNERFNESKGGIEKVRSKNLTDATNREEDYRSENSISRKNAERGSLARQAQRQALLDSMAGF